MSPSPPLDIHHDPARGRFEAVVDGRVNVAEYRLLGNLMRMTRTAVDPSLRGRGVAAALVAAALAHARAHGHRVDPVCSYVRGYIERHPEARELLE